LNDWESVSRRSPEATSHNLTVRSALALARILPSGRKQRQYTQPLCPESVLISLPVSRFQSLTFLIIAAGCQGVAVRGKSDRIKSIFMTFQDANELAIFEIPLADFAGH